MVIVALSSHCRKMGQFIFKLAKWPSNWPFQLQFSLSRDCFGVSWPCVSVWLGFSSDSEQNILLKLSAYIYVYFITCLNWRPLTSSCFSSLPSFFPATQRSAFGFTISPIRTVSKHGKEQEKTVIKLQRFSQKYGLCHSMLAAVLSAFLPIGTRCW